MVQHGCMTQTRVTRVASATGLLALLATVLVAPATVATPSHEPVPGGPITGRLLSAGGEGAVGGLVVRVRENVGGSPGAVVDTTTSAADGRFSVDASGSTPRVWVQVVGTTRWLGGHVGGESPAGVQADLSNANTYSPGTALGRTFIGPRFVRGVVTDAGSGDPVAGADVRLYAPGEAPSGTPERVLHTDAAGVFAATGLADEEYGIRISGATGYETGWVGCGYGVVATYEDACVHATGRLDRRVRLDPVT